MAQHISFDFDVLDYYNMALKNLEYDETELAIGNLRQAISLAPDFIDAYIKLAKAYRRINAVNVSNRVLYEALSKCRAADKGRICAQLALNCMKSHSPALPYYVNYPDADDFGYDDEDDGEYDYFDPDFDDDDFYDDFDSEMDSDVDIDLDDEFKLVYPRDDDYYFDALQRTCNLTAMQKYDEAIKILENVPPESKAKPKANHLILLNYLMREDFDAVIDRAKKMLADYGENLAVRCMLATAYALEQRVDEANAIMDDILSEERDAIDDVLLVLPVLLNLERHKDILKYTKIALKSFDLDLNFMTWLSQAEFNCGEVDEAKYTMQRVQKVYGEFSSAKYYLDYYESGADKVDYSTELPLPEKVSRTAEIKKLLLSDDNRLAAILRDSSLDGEFFELMRWAMFYGPDSLKTRIVERLAENYTAEVDKFFRQILISDVENDVNVSIIMALAYLGLPIYEFDIVAQGKFKSVKYFLPNTFTAFPANFRFAISYCLFEIIDLRRDPNLGLRKFCEYIKSIAYLGDDGKLVWSKPRYKKISLMRSVRTIVGAILTWVIDGGEDFREMCIDQFDLSTRTFEKYYNILFGDDDEN